ncbi:hypothetical protein, partial [uncultured Bifidobacterium sp.]|uniref:hypothetical protein n=1 Tax=uncultured Bifidobacterium sp. TaxID=165187 RepID=UPI0025940A7A
LTNSQTDTLPMAQSKIIPATQAEQKQNEARRFKNQYPGDSVKSKVGGRRHAVEKPGVTQC